MRSRIGLVLTLVLLVPAVLGSPARAERVPVEYQPAVAKGLLWLAKQQHKDGHWEGKGGQHPIPMTSLAGLALMMEGSTLREGQYRGNLSKAVDWVVARGQPNGLIGNPPSRVGDKYVFDHGFAMLFLACAVGDLEEGPQRTKIVRLLERAARYAREAQTKRGGWGYVTARDGGDFDEGACTATMIHGLRAAEQAGVRLPKGTLDDARKYLLASTDLDGSVMYSLTTRSKSFGPGLTAAAIACGSRADDRGSPLVKKWFQYCAKNVPVGGGRRIGYDEYTYFYYSQAVYGLGEGRWGKLFPAAPQREWVTWTKYRKALFDELKNNQSPDGSWAPANWTAYGIGPVYVTALYLCALQLDNGALPIFQR